MSTNLHKIIMSDAELVSASLANQEFFRVLVERYQEKIDRYIQRMTQVSREDKEDLLQNIFIKVYVNLNGFNNKLSFNSWIYRIAHNEIIDFSRKEKTKIKYGKYDYEDDIFCWIPGEKDFLMDIYADESRVEIAKVLQKIDLKYREVLVLKFIEGCSYQEMSDILKKPEGTIATRINRAKKIFKEYYEKNARR